jgi:transposase
MTLDEKVHGLRMHVIQRAAELGNVSRACREAGISRALFYRWRQRLERYGQDGVHPRRHRARPGRPVQLAPETERLLPSVAVSAATWGARRIAAYLRHRWQLRVAPSTVQRALRRAGLATRRQRLTVLEHRALQTVGLLTERTRRALWQARHGQPRHVAAREPGELVCLDAFYIGQLKGVVRRLAFAAPKLLSGRRVAGKHENRSDRSAVRGCAPQVVRRHGKGCCTSVRRTGRAGP